MPSEPMNIQEQGFRSSLFGFDKNDVLAYMNALANEAQQHELEYNRQLQQMQSRLDDLRSQQSSDDSRIEALKAEAAETRRRESEEQLEALQKQTASYQSNQRESQKNANIWQLKHHDLQQKNDDLQKQVEELQKQLDSARQLNTSSLSSPASDLVREAKLEAGKILADARLYAESAEKELKQQADSQKNRMAENARSIASGVMLVRERLARVDERLSAATLDLDGLTQAIYQALDQTEAELKELGTDMRSFAQGTPETDPPAPLPPRPAAAQTPAAKPADRLRVKAKKAQPAHHTPPAPAHRLRNTRRPVSQLLQDQIDRLNGEEQ